MTEESFAELREQFQKMRDYEMSLYMKATGDYEDYYIDDPEHYHWVTNVKEIKEHESP